MRNLEGEAERKRGGRMRARKKRREIFGGRDNRIKGGQEKIKKRVKRVEEGKRRRNYEIEGG